MKKVILAGFGVLLHSSSAFAQNSEQAASAWSLQFNGSPQVSRLIGIDDDPSVSRNENVDYAFGLTGQTALSAGFGVRSGFAIRRTRFRYGYEMPTDGNLPVVGHYEVRRTTFGIDVPLIFDVSLFGSEGPELRWLFGAGIHFDLQKNDDYLNLLPELWPTASHQPMYMSLMTGLELAVPVASDWRLLIAPQVGFTLPDRSAFAFNDYTPSASLMTASLRATVELPPMVRKPREEPAVQRKNVVMIGYGGRSYLRSGNITYERLLGHSGGLRTYASASGGTGPYGFFSSAGIIAAVGGPVNALDLGLSIGYVGSLGTVAPVPELGYRFSARSGLAGRLYMSYWEPLRYISPMSMGVSFGKAF